MSTHTLVLDDRYVVGDVIGRGGVADVHRATDRALGRAVAVKLLREVTASDDDRVRFTSEARTLAGLSHPGLVALLDAGSSTQPYLVMELVDGLSLAERIEGGALGTGEVVAIGIQLTEALAYAHGAGVVHRDVKPGNVLLADDGRALLADFGIARLLGDTARLTEADLAIGSPAYLSPEQVRGDEVTPASDVYSLGLVLLEALTGQRAYPGPATEAALARLTVSPLIPPQVQSKLGAVLASMMALDPSQRPTAADVAAALRHVGTAVVDVVAPADPDAAATQVFSLTSAPESEPAAGSATTRALHRAVRPSLWSSMRARIGWPVWAGAMVLLVLVVGAVLVLAGGDDSGEDVPPGVPAQYQEPLRDLHDAVNGDDR